MWEEFDTAVAGIKGFLKKNQYAYSTRAAHMRCYKRLRAHLTESGEAYSIQIAESWLKAISAAQCEGEAKVFRRALEKLDAAYNHREIGSTSSKSAMRQTYLSLAPWCNALLEGFVAEMSAMYGPDYTQAAKISAARFLTDMAGIGVCGPEGISHRMVVGYCREGGGVKGPSKIALSADKGHVRKFLEHLAGKGLIRASVHMALDQSVFPRVVFVDSLDDRDGFFAEAKSFGISAESYYEIALKMDPLVVQLKYAKTARHTFSIALKELFVFLDANSLRYSAGVALSWAKLMSKYTVQWVSFRRAIMLFEQFRENGRIDPGKNTDTCRTGQIFCLNGAGTIMRHMSD